MTFIAKNIGSKKMENRFIIKLTVLMLLLAQSAFAELIPTQQNFAYFATLSDGKQSLRQFELPYPVLAGLKRQDYGDMRIFNSQNQLVPFSIAPIEAQTYQNQESYNLGFFRVADHSTQHEGLKIEFSENSTRFSFDTVNDKSQPNYLLIENTHQNDALQAITLDWQQPDTAFSIKVKLESSDDLQNWQSVNDNVTLYDLKYADTSLLQNTVNLPAASHAKYLRLSFQPSSDFTLQIEKISGEYHHTTSVERENWQSFQLEPGEQPNEWLFHTGSLIPVSKIEFKIPATGLFYQGSLYSKNDSANQNSTRTERHHSNFKRDIKRALHHYPEYSPTAQDDWHYQGTVTQYRLLTAAGEIVSEPITVPLTKDKEWKLVLQQPSTLLAEQIPSVKVAWHPVQVTFLAQGKPPYQLFFSNPKIAPLTMALPPTLTNEALEIVDVQTIHIVKKIVAMNEEKTWITTVEQLNWRKILLWLLLCAGVLVMGVMAYQLYVKMNQNKD
jgi:Protein of unknown function (DUF3999)